MLEDVVLGIEKTLDLLDGQRYTNPVARGAGGPFQNVVFGEPFTDVFKRVCSRLGVFVNCSFAQMLAVARVVRIGDYKRLSALHWEICTSGAVKGARAISESV